MFALTSREMREIDRLAVEETGPALLQMMENAGRSMAVLTLRKLRDVYPAARVVVLAGPGGNGGGGICAARHLAWRLDEVGVCLSAPVEELSEATRVQLDLFLATGRTVVSAADLTQSEPPDLIVDALVGCGLRDAPRGEAAILGVEGGEVVTVLQMAMMGDLPYTVLRDAVIAHPTLAESLNNLFMTLDD